MPDRVCRRVVSLDDGKTHTSGGARGPPEAPCAAPQCGNRRQISSRQQEACSMQHTVCIESICTIQTLSAHTVHSWVGFCIPHLHCAFQCRISPSMQRQTHAVCVLHATRVDNCATHCERGHARVGLPFTLVSFSFSRGRACPCGAPWFLRFLRKSLGVVP